MRERWGGGKKVELEEDLGEVLRVKPKWMMMGGLDPKLRLKRALVLHFSAGSSLLEYSV